MKREAPRKWTPVEDEIFLHIMYKVVKARMWDAVKEDGRLGYRGAPGIAALVTAVVSLPPISRISSPESSSQNRE
jgi:hypothetical protein